MIPRKRKKEPPDLLLSIFDLPFDNDYLADLAIAAPNLRFSSPAFPSPRPVLVFAWSSVIQCAQICSFGILALRPSIEHPFKPSMQSLLCWCSPPSRFVTPNLRPYAPEGKPTTRPIPLRSRAVLFRSSATCRSVAETIGDAPLNRCANVFYLCEFQVCVQNFSPFIFLFKFCWLFSVMICCCPGFDLMLLYHGLPCSYTFDYGRPRGCINLCVVLQLTMAVYFLSLFWTANRLGFEFWLENLPILAMFTRLLLSFYCTVIALKSTKAKYLAGNLGLTCPFSLVLPFGNRLLKDCGKCVLYCISIVFCDHSPTALILEPNLYTLRDVINGWPWWMGFCFPNPCSQLLCRSPYLPFVHQQQALMCRMTDGIVDNLPEGGLFSIMMKIFNSPLAAWVALCVYWGLTLFWLSLLLERLAAPKHDPLWSRFCWQLVVFQIDRDEVTGKNPYVYEDLLSETSIAPFLALSRGNCLLVRWFGAGTWQSYDWPMSWAASMLTFCCRDFGAITNSIVPFTSSLCCLAGMYCSCTLLLNLYFQLEFPVMLVVEHLQCNNSTVGRCIFGCCIPCCIHYGRCCQNKTLGPCLMALEQHRRMLGTTRRGFGLCLLALDVPPWRLRPALYGCCFVRNFAIWQYSRLQLSARLTISSAVTHLLNLCLGSRLAPLFGHVLYANCFT